MVIKKDIQTTHNREGIVASDEYYTPKPLIDALGEFDLDPCAAPNARWATAKTMWTRQDDGLSRVWTGRVWLNPPYSRPLIEQFMQRMADHGNGIALIIPKFGTKMFREVIFPAADSIFILRQRVRFFDLDWWQQTRPVCQSMLVSFSEADTQAILRSGLEGQMLLPVKPTDHSLQVCRVRQANTCITK